MVVPVSLLLLVLLGLDRVKMLSPLAVKAGSAAVALSPMALLPIEQTNYVVEALALVSSASLAASPALMFLAAGAGFVAVGFVLPSSIVRLDLTGSISSLKPLMVDAEHAVGALVS